MRKLISVLTITVLLILAGCSKSETVEHKYTFKGENESWAIEYRVDGKEVYEKADYRSSSDDILTVTYKKDLSQLSSVKQIGISYKSSAGGGSNTEEFSKNNPPRKTYVIKSSGSGNAIESKDEIIKANISLDGKTQEIDLKNIN